MLSSTVELSPRVSAAPVVNLTSYKPLVGFWVTTGVIESMVVTVKVPGTVDNTFDRASLGSMKKTSDWPGLRASRPNTVVVVASNAVGLTTKVYAVVPELYTETPPTENCKVITPALVVSAVITYFCVARLKDLERREAAKVSTPTLMGRAMVAVSMKGLAAVKALP